MYKVKKKRFLLNLYHAEFSNLCDILGFIVSFKYHGIRFLKAAFIILQVKRYPVDWVSS